MSISSPYASSNSADITGIQHYYSSIAFSVTGLGINVPIKISGISDAAADTTLTFNSGFTASKTLTLQLYDVTEGTLTFTDSGGSFDTINIDSAGTAQNALPANGLAGNALASVATIAITGATNGKDLYLPTSSDLDSVTTLTSSSDVASRVNFGGSTRGTSGNTVTVTMSKAGSGIEFATTSALASGNSFTFTGSGNTLAMTYDAAVATAAAIGIAVNINRIEIADTPDAVGTITLTDIVAGTDLIFTSAPTAVVTVNGIAAAKTVYIGDFESGLGKSTHAPLASTSGCIFNTASSGATLNYEVQGTVNAGSAVDQTFELGTNVTTLTMTLGTGANTNSSFSVTSTALTTWNITGGNASASYTMASIPATVTTVDASGSAGGIVATLPDSVTAFTGSSTAENTVSGNGLTSVTLGSGADIVNVASGDTSSFTVTVGGGADIIKYQSIQSTQPIVTVTDFDPGTSSTAVDKVYLAAGVNLCGFSGGTGTPLLKRGASANDPVSAEESVVMQTMSSLTAISGSTTNIIKYTTGISTPSSNASELSALVMGAAPTVNDALVPFMYIDTGDSRVHIGVVHYKVGDTTPDGFKDILIFSDQTSLTDFDVSDFSFIGEIIGQ